MRRRTMTIRLAFVLGALVAAVACDNPNGPAPPPAASPSPAAFTVAGLVTEGGFGLAQANVEIVAATWGSLSSSTDGSGAYSFSGVPKGNFTVRAEKEGFTTQVKPLTVASNMTVNFDLQRIDVRGDFSGVGAYTLTFTASPSCAALPPEVMRRSYHAQVEENQAGLVVKLSGADFVGWGNEPGFVGQRDGNSVHFQVSADIVDSDYAVMERVGNADLYYSGLATGAIGEKTISAVFSGKIGFRPLGGSSAIECQAADHRLEFVR